MSDDGNDDAFDVEGGDGVVHTEVESENIFERLKDSFGGMCIGIILFFASFPLLFWNEGRAVDRYKALNEAQAEVASVSGMMIDPANEGKLLHFSVGITNNGTVLRDPIFGVESDGLKLSRTAEMYQWNEKKQTSSKEKVGGGKTTTTTYTYEKEWETFVVNSQNFKKPDGHQNPTAMEFQSTQMVGEIMIGAYDLPPELVGRIDWQKSVVVDIANITNESIRGRAVKTSDGFYLGPQRSSTSNVTSASNPANAQVGDQRVKFTETPESTISIIGVQKGNTLRAFVSEAGDGSEVLLFQQGSYSSVELFDAAEADNAALTWVLRIVGYALMTLGLYLVFRPIEVFADIIPCVGSIIGCGIIFMAALISAILSTIVISIAWLVARPKIGAAVLFGTLAVIGLIAFGVKKLQEMKGKTDDDESPDDEKVVIPTVHAEKVASEADEPEVYVSSAPYVPNA